jgi:hypothetical protein
MPMRWIAPLLIALCATANAGAQQMSDPDFDASVKSPAYVREHPRVITGEATMFSAQVVKMPGQPDFKAGMNLPGNDDRQFALNVLHWLSKAPPK